jgi:hypothetical protein
MGDLLMQLRSLLTLSLVGGLTIGMGSAALAVPYAANVRNTTGNTWEFVVNEASDNVTVLRNGANPVNLGALAPGRYTFDMTGFSSFDIKVAKNAASAWTTISGAGNAFTNFTMPSGLAVNRSASNLAYFGTVYVGNANPAATQAGRLLGDGIYSLTADMKGVDLGNNFAVVADPNDTTQAKAPGFATDGSLTSSPWRLNLDAAGNLIIADWSDPRGGIKYASPNLTSGGLVLANEDGIRPLLLNGSNQEFHGSIAAKVYTTGSVGNNLVVYGMDEDMDSDGETAINATNGNNIWKWNVGNATSYDQAPQLWINSTNIPKTSDNRSNFLNLNIGVAAGMTYSPTFNKWYLTEPRADGDQSCLTILTAPGDGSSTVAWSSLQWSIDNNLDGNTAFPVTPLGGTLDIQDMFRYARDVAISNDGKYLIVNRSTYLAARNGLGDGAVYIIPLDANGIPDIHVEAGQITNVVTVPLVNNTLAHTSGAQVEVDAAGNVYVADSGLVTGNAAGSAQLIQVLSPGGNWVATTSSNGTFNLTPGAVSLSGDYNSDGKVDAADYVIWRDDPAGHGGSGGYDTWRANFGATAGSGSLAGSSVPEPGTLVIAAVGLLIVGVRRGSRAL